MTYDQHAVRLAQLHQFHEELSIKRKRNVVPGTDIAPFAVVIGRDGRCFGGDPGPLLSDYMGGVELWQGHGVHSMLLIYAESVLELMERTPGFVPMLVALSNEGYVRSFDTNTAEGKADAAAYTEGHRLGDFEHQYKAGDSRVREALLTTLLSFPPTEDDDAEPTFSMISHPFEWHGSELVLDPLPTEDSSGGTGGVLQVGQQLTPQHSDSNQYTMIRMIQAAVIRFDTQEAARG